MKRNSILLIATTLLLCACNPDTQEGIDYLLLDTSACTEMTFKTEELIDLWAVKGKDTTYTTMSINGKALNPSDKTLLPKEADKYFASYPQGSVQPRTGKASLPTQVSYKDSYKTFPAAFSYTSGGELLKVRMQPACNYLEITVSKEDEVATLSQLEIIADTPICGQGNLVYGKIPYCKPDTKKGSAKLSVDLGPYGVTISNNEKLKIIVPIAANTTLGSLKIDYTISGKSKTETIINEERTLGFGEKIEAKINESTYGRMTIEQRIAAAPLMHHMNVETDGEKNFIPSQSLIDIRYAKALGFNAIEGNVHKTYDGSFVIKHGKSGALGKGLKYRTDASDKRGDLENIKFSDVTYRWLCDNVVYDSPIKENCVSIPTVQEFALECRNNDMAFVADVNENGVLEIVRGILPDNMIVAYNLKDRTDFQGAGMHWKSSEDINEILNYARRYGTPYIYSWDSYTSKNLEPAFVKSVADALHAEGYILATAYATPQKVIDGLKLGIDWIASTNKSINSFDQSDLYNITSLSNLTKTENGYVLYDNSCADKFVKVRVMVRYTGSLSITIGGDSRSNAIGIMYCENDGTKLIDFSIVSEKNPTLCRIFTEGQTIIDSISITASEVQLL